MGFRIGDFKQQIDPTVLPGGKGRVATAALSTSCAR